MILNMFTIRQNINQFFEQEFNYNESYKVQKCENIYSKCIDDDDDHDTDEYKDDNDIIIVVYVTRLFYDIVQMVLTKKSPEKTKTNIE